MAPTRQQLPTAALACTLGSRALLFTVFVVSFLAPAVSAQTTSPPANPRASSGAVLQLETSGPGAGVVPPDALAKGPKDARVTIVEFSDFECPFCGRSVSVLNDLLKAHPNEIRFIFKNNPLPIHSKARLAHEAALAAAAQGKFWEMHDLLYSHQEQLNSDDLLRYAQQLQLNIDAFRQALIDHRYEKLVDEDTTEAKAFGVNATPTFFINGKKLVGSQTLDSFEKIVQGELGAKLGTGSGENLLPRQQIRLEGAPIRGAPSAPVTIVEFSDFQCPFCAASVSTIQRLLELYPGQVRLVYKNFPLELHPDAPLAHQAALAAKRQGKFWEMHDQIFSNQRAIKRDGLIRSAMALGLDMDRFIADMDGNAFASVVEADKEDGNSLGVTGTPTFVINGKILVGARPLAEFRAAVDAALKAAATHESATTAGLPATGTNSRPLADEIPTSETSKGPKDAPVNLTWFADIRSPLAARSQDVVKELMDLFPGKIRITFRNFPLAFHTDALMAHEAALAAGAQGKFWEMQNLIVSKHPATLKEADVIAYAAELGLNGNAFAQALNERKYQPAIEKDLAEGQSRDVRGAPVFFVNDQRVDGLQPVSVLKQMIESELNRGNRANP